MKRIIQILATIIVNGYFPAIYKGGIYQGSLKRVCWPVLNCWGCPTAMYGCPAGGLQHFIGLQLIPWVVLGILGTVGAAVGRMACGWICPFGLFQDLLFKIRSFKMRMPVFFKFFKYGVLVLVAGLVVYKVGEPWFCKLCPDGLLIAGFPLVLFDKTGDLRALIGWHYYMKIAIFILIVLSSITMKRFFCRSMCIIGAVYSIFNRFSFTKLRLNKDKCRECGSCQNVCPMDVPVYKQQNHIDCIRCLDCVYKCPSKALKYGI